MMLDSDVIPPPPPPPNTCLMSVAAQRTINPIRGIVDVLQPDPNHPQLFITLGLGDPTIFGNMDCHEAVADAVRNATRNPKIHGYGPALGLPETRKAIADRYNGRFDGVSYTADDIFMTCGCSHALQMAISGTVSEGAVVLLPRPGFSIYHTIADHFGIVAVDYPLTPDRQWEIDLAETEKLIVQHKPAAWLINNPSNPCGSVYSKAHLQQCLEIAQKYKLLIIADEIYEDIVFEGNEYVPMASVSSPDQVVVTCSGLAKRFMVPGWRLGWIALHDPKNAAQALRTAFFNLAGLILGPCTLIQAAVPEIFHMVPHSFNQKINKALEENAQIFINAFGRHPRSSELPVSLIKPQGTLYMMIRLPPGTDDVKWCQDLLKAENLLLLPGTVPFLPLDNVFCRYSECPALPGLCSVLHNAYLRKQPTDWSLSVYPAQIIK